MLQHPRTFALALGSLLFVALPFMLACEPELIPNTRVEDTEANREVVDFVEKYRTSVEQRNVAALLAMASQNYFDDMGTPAGDDDVDYDGLKAGLERIRSEVLGARYQVSYRAVTYAADRKVLVDVLYTGWFRVTTSNGPEWKRHLEPHRLVLEREPKGYKILSGM
jgi:hypothetical protein